MTTPQELRETILAVGYAAVFFLAVLGAIAAAGEYRHRTISQRFLASPARHRVLLAKLRAYAVVGAGAALVVTAVASAVGQAVVSSKGYTLDLGDGGLRMSARHRPRHRARGHARRRGRRDHPQPDDRHGRDLRRLDRREDRRRLDRRGGASTSRSPLIENVLGLIEPDGVGLRGARARRPDRRARRSSPSAGSSRGT